MSEQLTFIDLFAGVGGFRRGMELAGHKCVGYCEWDKCASASYRMMHTVTDEQLEYLVKKYLKKWNIGIKGLDWFLNNTLNKNGKKKLLKEIEKEEYLNGEWYSNDIRAVDADSVPRADVWCFGAPCQDFSIAGNRAGLEGDKSSLVREVFRIIGEIEEESRPEWLIYENVKGMFSSNKGFDYLEILLAMDELGYDIEWQLFNSKDFGVPQNRERVYTIGHLRRYGRRKIFPIRGNNTEIGIEQVGMLDIKGKEQMRRIYGANGLSPCLSTMQGGHQEPKIKVIGTTAPNPYKEDGTLIKDKCTRNWVYDTSGLMCTLSATDYKTPKQILIGNVNPSGSGMNGNVFDSQGLSPTLNTNKGEGLKVAIPVLTPDRIEKRQKGRRFKEDGEPMFTLTAQDRHGVMVREATKQGYAIATPGVAQTLTTSCNQATLTNKMRIRKLTPRECFRLQGWADDYFERAALVNSDSQLYKQAGNGVTVNVVQAISEKLTKGSVTHE